MAGSRSHLLVPSARIIAADLRNNHEECASNARTGQKNANQNHPYVHATYGKTVFGDRLICMEHGLSKKMLKRHLPTVHGMTSTSSVRSGARRTTTPLVARDYAKLRSTLAVQGGPGLKPEDRPASRRKALQSPLVKRGITQM